MKKCQFVRSNVSLIGLPRRIPKNIYRPAIDVYIYLRCRIILRMLVIFLSFYFLVNTLLAFMVRRLLFDRLESDARRSVRSRPYIVARWNEQEHSSDSDAIKRC